MKKVCYIQPIIANYSAPLFSELSKHWQLTVLYSPAKMTPGYANDATTFMCGVDCREVPMVKPLGNKIGMYQIGIIRQLKYLRPDAVIIFANMRYFSFWTTIIWCHIHGLPVYPRGHGVYKKDSPGFFWKVIYRLVLWFSTAYIAYTPSVAASLLGLDLPKSRIAVADNSLVNTYPIRPSERTGNETGILFVGRLRSGTRLDLLIRAVAQLRVSGYSNVTLHVIGDGTDASRILNLAENTPWMRFYGSVYDPEKISAISRDCMLGCYPGNAGLSIVHLMSLSLPPITHDNLAAHQGPEPSYIKSGKNGLLFDHRSPESGLLSALVYMIGHPVQLKKMQVAAYATYTQLTQPSLAERLIKIVGE